MVAWFAGLFYLPRLFVNHAMAEEEAVKQRLTLMEGKLYRFITPWMLLTLIFGFWLLYEYAWAAYRHIGLFPNAVAAPEAVAGSAAGGVSLLLRQAGARLRRGQKPALPRLVPLVQRSPGAGAVRVGDSGYRQTFLKLRDTILKLGDTILNSLAIKYRVPKGRRPARLPGRHLDKIWF